MGGGQVKVTISGTLVKCFLHQRNLRLQPRMDNRRQLFSEICKKHKVREELTAKRSIVIECKETVSNYQRSSAGYLKSL